MKILTLAVGDLDTNCYVLYDEHSREAMVIDPGDEAQRVVSTVQQKGLQVTAIVLTHAHFDHLLGAKAVQETTGAPLWVGAGDKSTLADPHKNLSSFFNSANAVSLTAQRWLTEGDVLTVGTDTLTVLETPGHTPGGISLQGQGLLISGDTLFAGSIGRLDFPGGDAIAMEQSLRRLATLPEDTAVYPGHGPATTIGRERVRNPYLQRL